MFNVVADIAGIFWSLFKEEAVASFRTCMWSNPGNSGCWDLRRSLRPKQEIPMETSGTRASSRAARDRATSQALTTG